MSTVSAPRTSAARSAISKIAFAGIDLSAILLLAHFVRGEAKHNSADAAPKPKTAAHAVANFGKLPLMFERNQGQTDPGVKFLSRDKGYTLWLTAEEAVMAFAQNGSSKRAKLSENSFPNQRAQDPVLRMRLQGANHNPEIRGLDEMPGRSHYFVGNDPAKWHRNVPNYTRVRYSNVYPGIDLVYYGNQNQLEYDFVVSPGADPGKIKLSVTGAERIRVDKAGDLVVHAANNHEVRWRKPAVFQEADGKRSEIAGEYLVSKK